MKNRKKGHNNKVLNIYSGDNILSEYKTVGSGSLTFRKNYINGIGTDSVIAYDVDESTNQDQISFCQNRVLLYSAEFTTYGYTNIVNDCNNAQNSSTGIVTNRYYYHTNQLGSIIALTNSTGAVVQVYSYDAFGKVYVVNGNGTGTTMIDISTYTGNTYSNTRLYTGREYDRESGLYYLRARYYSPDTGRFISRDPIGQNDQINLYTYVANSPLKYTDRNGKVKQILTETGERLLRWTADALLLVLSPGTASAPGDQTYDADMAKGRAMDDRIINPAGGALAISVILPTPAGKKKAGETFFEGAKYTEKVFKQFSQDAYHGFSPVVDKFAAKFGKVDTVIGKWGQEFERLTMEGSYRGKEGVFEYIKDAAGNINHRFFK